MCRMSPCYYTNHMNEWGFWVGDIILYTTLTPQIKGKSQCINVISHGVRYRKYRTLRCADILLVHCYNALMQEMKLPLFYIGARMRYQLWI